MMNLNDNVKILTYLSTNDNEIGDIGTITKLHQNEYGEVDLYKVSVPNKKDSGNWYQEEQLQLVSIHHIEWCESTQINNNYPIF